MKHACISIIENVLVILLSYIIARKISDIPFNKLQIKVFKQIDYRFIYKQIDVLNKKIEQFYNNIFYNYQYKLANNLVYINNSQYKNQVRHLLIGLLIVCIILLF